MRANSRGWIIIGVLLVVIVLGIYALTSIWQISSPTEFGRDAANLAKVELPVAPGTVVAMDAPADATAVYKQAIAEFALHPDEYRIDRLRIPADSESLPVIRWLLEVRRAAAGRIFAAHPERIVGYESSAAMEPIHSLGLVLSRRALLLQKTDPSSAVAHFEAEFALGNRLYEERLTASEFLAGVSLMSEASAGMARVPDAAKYVDPSKLSAFDQGWKQLRERRVQPMLGVLQSIDAQIVADRAGDIFQFANRAQERMWRVEAILALGRMRFFVGQNGRAADQRGANRVLSQLSSDPDPIIRLAVVAASSLTIEQYRMLR